MRAVHRRARRESLRVIAAQLPLGLRFAPDQRLSTFHEAPAGLLPALERLARGAGGDSVLLSGASAAGKSHLLLATCAEAGVHDILAAYLPLRRYAADAAAALANLRAVRLACVDDVQAIAGDRAAEIALFDLHNRVRDGGGALLYASDATPAQLALALPDLRSRLAQCTQFALTVPDEAQRRDILRERAAARGLEMDDTVLDWLFRRVGRDLISLTSLLDRLDRASLAAQRRITVPFLRAVIESS